MAKQISYPGVYTQELNAFPMSVVGAPTAVPTFVGYTEKAIFNGKNIAHVPTRITSLKDYLQYFGGAPKTGFHLQSDSKQVFKLTPPSGRFFLFDSLQLYFANGGTDCYIVSIGTYANAQKPEIGDFYNSSQHTGAPKGIDALLTTPDVTLLVCPDAVGLENAMDCYQVQQKMLDHCGSDTQNRFAILDIWSGYRPRTYNNSDIITAFRTHITSNLQWGAAYYPWLNAVVVPEATVDFTDIAPDSRANLTSLLQNELQHARKDGKIWDQQQLAAIEKAIKGIATATEAGAVIQIHKTLLATSSLYVSLMRELRQSLNVLPPSGAIAGIYCMVDQTRGIFHAPANVGIASAATPTVLLSDNDQQDLNSPLNGKAICAIRMFPGQGMLIWGARTLDGNNQDWRYINVRRTTIYIEQSIKNALQAFVFEPNDANTWASVKGMIGNFLTGFWRDGGLAGSKAEDAFNVQIGLGTTMTNLDISNGTMRVSVAVAMMRPAEFIVLSFEQQMAQKS